MPDTVSRLRPVLRDLVYGFIDEFGVRTLEAHPILV